MKYIVKGYEFMDVMFKSKDNEELKESYLDWHHKERITKVYAIMDKEDIKRYNELNLIELDRNPIQWDTDINELIEILEEDEENYIIYDN